MYMTIKKVSLGEIIMKVLSFFTRFFPKGEVWGVILFFFFLTVLAQEKTTFQTAGPWKPVTDIRSDLVMV